VASSFHAASRVRTIRAEGHIFHIRPQACADAGSAAVTRPLEPDELRSQSAWKALLGTKVSLRYRLHDDESHPFSEAIGMVQSVALDDEGRAVLTVVNRRGEASSMALDDILAAKSL
jgi:hypothetical protein